MSLLSKMDAAIAAKDETTMNEIIHDDYKFTMHCLLYTSPSPRD